jgi:hypothetical protein
MSVSPLPHLFRRFAWIRGTSLKSDWRMIGPALVAAKAALPGNTPSDRRAKAPLPMQPSALEWFTTVNLTVKNDEFVENNTSTGGFAHVP